MSISDQLLLPRQFYTDMIQHAQSELPNECCGLLAGARDGDTLRVLARHALVNEVASPTEYLSDPRSMLDADKAMRAAEHEIVAVYHSHPSSEPVPSKKDLERNYYGDTVVHFIVGLAGSEPVVRGWWLTETAFTEATWQIVEA